MLEEYIGKKFYIPYRKLIYKNNISLHLLTEPFKFINNSYETINEYHTENKYNISLLIFILQTLNQGSLAKISKMFGEKNLVTGSDHKITVFDKENGIITRITAITPAQPNYSKVILGYFLQPIKLVTNYEEMTQKYYQQDGKFIFIPTYFKENEIISGKIQIIEEINNINTEYIQTVCQKQFQISMNHNIFPCLNKVSHDKRLRTARTYKNILGRMTYNDYSCTLGSKYWANNLCSYSGLINYINIFEGSIKNEMECANSKNPTDYQTNIIDYIVRFLNYTDIVNNIPTNLYITLDAFVLSKIFDLPENEINSLDIFKISKTFTQELRIQHFIKTEIDTYIENTKLNPIKLKNLFRYRSHGKLLQDKFNSYHTIYLIAQFNNNITIKSTLDLKSNANIEQRRINVQLTPSYEKQQYEKQFKIIDPPISSFDIELLNKTLNENIIKLGSNIKNNNQRIEPIFESENLLPQNIVKEQSLPKTLLGMSILNINNASNNIFVSSYTTQSIYIMTFVANILLLENPSNIQKQNYNILQKLIAIINAFYNIKLELYSNNQLISSENDLIKSYQQTIIDNGLTGISDIQFTKSNIDFIMNYFINQIINTKIPVSRIDFKTITLPQLKENNINTFDLKDLVLPPTLAQRFAVTKRQIGEKIQPIIKRAANLTRKAGQAIKTGIETIKKTKISLADPNVFPPFDSREKHGTKKITTRNTQP